MPDPAACPDPPDHAPDPMPSGPPAEGVSDDAVGQVVLDCDPAPTFTGLVLAVHAEEKRLGRRLTSAEIEGAVLTKFVCRTCGGPAYQDGQPWEHVAPPLGLGSDPEATADEIAFWLWARNAAAAVNGERGLIAALLAYADEVGVALPRPLLEPDEEAQHTRSRALLTEKKS